MLLYKHPRFRDVAIKLIHKSNYKPGYTNIRFYWVYPPGNGIEHTRFIFSQPSKMQMTNEKWGEFETLNTGE